MSLHLRVGDTISAWTEYDMTEDGDNPGFVDVAVTFRITVRGYAATHDGPADGPEGEIEMVHIGSLTFALPAPPEIDAWARHPDRFSTLFQRALDNA